MNSYGHELYHNNHAREQEANAKQYRLGYQIKKNTRPTYKAIIATLAGTFILIGTTLQDISEL